MLKLIDCWIVLLALFPVALCVSCMEGREQPATVSSAADYGTEYEAQIHALSSVKRRLKAPSTAEFFSVRTKDMPGIGKFQVLGTVEAANGFNAPCRSRFICDLRCNQGKWTIQSMWIE